MDTLGALDIFLLVAERLSFAEAGRQLGLSPSAVGKAIARLETRLGVRLLSRTTRRASLTAEGEVLLERARRIRDEVDDLAATLAQAAAQPRGRLRVSLPTIGYRFLVPHLPTFARAYPMVELDLDFNDGLVDLVGGGVDVAIRSGAMADSGLMSRKLAGFRFIICASPAYVARRGEPATVEALADHALIRYRRPGSDGLQSWALPTPLAEAALPSPAIVTTNMEAVLAAVIAGLGIAYMPDFLAADGLGRGELLQLLPDEEIAGEFWLLWPGGRGSSPRLRAFIGFAAEFLFHPVAPSGSCAEP